MLNSSIFCVRSLLFRSSARFISTSQKCLSDEIYNKNFQIQMQELAKKEKESTLYKEMIDEKTKRWKEKHEIYYGKERDFVNYPTLVQPEYHPKVRMGFLPDEWFNALYNKTGVTGPYLFLWGGVIFFMQKEYLVYDHELFEVPAIFMALVLLHKKLGPLVRPMITKIMNKKEWAIAIRPKEKFEKLAKKKIAAATESKSSSDVVVDLLEGAKENVGLQLESVYRSRVSDVHKLVKNRLDYQVEKEVSKLRYQKQHMIDWIVSSVEKDFSVEQERATLSQCINDLRALAQKSTSALA